jgi:hypothetical protein
MKGGKCDKASTKLSHRRRNGRCQARGFVFEILIAAQRYRGTCSPTVASSAPLPSSVGIAITGLAGGSRGVIGAYLADVWTRIWARIISRRNLVGACRARCPSSPSCSAGFRSANPSAPESESSLPTSREARGIFQDCCSHSFRNCHARPLLTDRSISYRRISGLHSVSRTRCGSRIVRSTSGSIAPFLR